MSFNLNIPDILQYAYNLFASALPAIYLFLGVAFGAYAIKKIKEVIL